MRSYIYLGSFIKHNNFESTLPYGVSVQFAWQQWCQLLPVPGAGKEVASGSNKRPYGRESGAVDRKGAGRCAGVVSGL